MSIEAADITPVFVEWFYENAIEGWFEGQPVDWESALSRVESSDLDFGSDMRSPGILKLQREIRNIRRM